MGVFPVAIVSVIPFNGSIKPDMTLPTYRRTFGPFVTLYRCSGGAEVELGCWFGTTAHASADACQQQDLLRLAERGTAAATLLPANWQHTADTQLTTRS